MANRYSQVTQTPYVSQYVPAPTNQFAQIAKQSRDRFEKAKLQDAETRALAMRTLGTASTPEERKMIEKIVRPTIEELDQRAQEGNYHEALMEAKTQGIEATSRIQSLKDARSKRATMKEEFLEQNPDVDPEELQFRLDRNLPGLQFDEKTRYVGLGETEGLGNLAPDVNVTEKVQKYLNDTEPTYMGEKVTMNPETGQIVTRSGKKLGTRRANRIITQALEGDRETQNYLNRREEFHTMKAQNAMEQGQDPLASIIRQYEDRGLGNEVRAELEAMPDYLSDAEKYGRFMRQSERDQAVGFGLDKYTYYKPDTKRKNIPQDTLEKLNTKDTGDDHAYLGQIQGPNDLPEDVDFTQGPTPSEKAENEGVLVQGRYSTGDFGAKSSGQASKHYANTEEFIQDIEDPQVKSVLSSLDERLDTREGESTEDRMKRLNKAYNKFSSHFNRSKNTMHKINDPEGEIRDRWFGDPNDPSIGEAALHGYSIIREDGTVGETRQFADIAKELGLDQKELASKMSVVGQIGGGEGNIAPGSLVVQVPYTKDEWGWSDDGPATSTMTVDLNSVGNEREFGVRGEIAKLKNNAGVTEGKPFAANVKGEVRQMRPVRQTDFVKRDKNGNFESVSPDHPDAEVRTNIVLETIDNRDGSKGSDIVISEEENPELFKTIIERGRIPDNL